MLKYFPDKNSKDSVRKQLKAAEPLWCFHNLGARTKPVGAVPIFFLNFSQDCFPQDCYESTNSNILPQAVIGHNNNNNDNDDDKMQYFLFMITTNALRDQYWELCSAQEESMCLLLDAFQSLGVKTSIDENILETIEN